METSLATCLGVEFYLLHRSLSPMLLVLMVKFWKVLFCAAARESAESATRAMFWRMVAKRESGRR